jgi:hypothetical protein
MVDPSLPKSSEPDGDTTTPGCVRMFVGLWAWGMLIIGTIGTLCGLLSFLKPGRVDGFRLMGKAIETPREKLVFTAFGLGFALVGLLFVRLTKNWTRWK